MHSSLVFFCKINNDIAPYYRQINLWNLLNIWKSYFTDSNGLIKVTKTTNSGVIYSKFFLYMIFDSLFIFLDLWKFIQWHLKIKQTSPKFRRFLRVKTKQSIEDRFFSFNYPNHVERISSKLSLHEEFGQASLLQSISSKKFSWRNPQFSS